MAEVLSPPTWVAASPLQLLALGQLEARGH